MKSRAYTSVRHVDKPEKSSMKEENFSVKKDSLRCLNTQQEFTRLLSRKKSPLRLIMHDNMTVSQCNVKTSSESDKTHNSRSCGSISNVKYWLTQIKFELNAWSRKIILVHKNSIRAISTSGFVFSL